VATVNKPYHHGDLAPALLRAAEEILEQDGPQALTLRSIARRAGVSHMAPAHHFGDVTGLLSELAAMGYRRFAARLCAAQQGLRGGELSRASGRAYVAFARDEPGMFLLMFRSERLDFSRPALVEAASGAARALRASAGVTDETVADPSGAAGRAGLARMVFEWSLVHGFAMLLIDGRLDGVLAGDDGPRDVLALLDDVMQSEARAPS
jgi:AcrR family transcriptional regulator